MERQAATGADIGLAFVLIVVAVVAILGTQELPPGSFEPLGSATIPQVVSGGIIVFSVWIAVPAITRRQKTTSDEERAELARAYRPRRDLATMLMLLCVLYVAVMAMDWVRFSVATLVFLFVAIGMLTAFQTRTLVLIVVLAAMFGFGLEYLFTQVFVIDLP